MRIERINEQDKTSYITVTLTREQLLKIYASLQDDITKGGGDQDTLQMTGEMNRFLIDDAKSLGL
ncbi:MAG: hypothetical protein WAM14_16810 [Candidatus Nitrosopolaris sp.]